MDIATLSATAKALVAPGKGILAADESSGTIKKRFDSISVESTEDNRRDYREMLFTAKGVGEYISGVILFDETIRQDAADGTSLVKLLEGQGIIPGIKVDHGRQAARRRRRRDGHRRPRRSARAPGRVPRRSARASPSGARRTRSPTRCPSAYCIDVNAHALARVRRAVPGGRHRADRRARGPDGRRAHDRALLRGHVGGARRARTRRCSSSGCASTARC